MKHIYNIKLKGLKNHWEKQGLKEYNIKTNEPAVNFFLMNFDKVKISSEQVYKRLANKSLILRKMTQYKIPSALRLTIGNKDANEYFIQSIRSIFS